MLIYSEERLVPTDVNMLTIKGANNGYYYIHRALYDQAVIINDIYKDDVPMLIKDITNGNETREDVETFMETAPSPIRILGPFLLLVKEELHEFVDMVGAIHVMSGPINLRGLLKYPYEMRNNPTFSLSIREEYELAWDRFFKTTMPFSVDAYSPVGGYRPMNGTDTVTVPTTGDAELSNIGDDGEEYADPLEALLFGAGDDIFDIPLDEPEEEPVKAAVEPEPEPVVQKAEPEPKPAPAKKIVTGIDALLAM